VRAEKAARTVQLRGEQALLTVQLRTEKALLTVQLRTEKASRDNVLRMTCAADQSRGRIAPAIRPCQVDTRVVQPGGAMV